MHSIFQKWIDEMNDEVIIVQSTDINEEAIENMMTFGLSTESVHSFGRDSVEEFLLNCRDIYKSKNNKEPMVFYSWLDEQSGQLRTSAVSSRHNKLPFECKYEKCDLESMISVLFTRISGLFDEAVCLKVWQSNI